MSMIAALFMMAETPITDPNWWIITASSDTGGLYFIKAKDLYQGPGIHDVWVKEDLSKDKTSKARSAMTLYRFDCHYTQMGVVERITHLPTGETQETSGGIIPTMRPIAPETIGEVMFNTVCGKKQ